MRQIYTYSIVLSIASYFFFISILEIRANSLINDSIVVINKNRNLIETRDTSHIGELPKEYKTLKSQYAKHKWTKELFSFLIKEAPPPSTKNENKPIVEDYKPYEGKVIRNINITVLSPFGTVIENPDLEPSRFAILNDAHVSTRKSTIRSIIQFKKHKAVNPAVIAASEAELRRTSYISDARIMVVPIEQYEDSVDVNVVVRDRWTIGVDLHGLSSSKVDIEVFDKNILGSGSRAGLNFIYSTKYDKQYGYGGNYLYENFARQNINLGGSYLDKIRGYDMEFFAERPIQLKYNYFGEISYSKDVLRTEWLGWDSISPDHKENFSVTVGRAFTLSDHNSIRRLALSLRYKIKSPEYRDKEYQAHVQDILLPYKYTKNKMLLMQLSLFQNSYQREYMIYNFGNTEDIAQGYNISTQLGYSSFKHIRDGMYTSLSFSYGSNKLLKGNIYTSSSISSFFDKKKPYESILKFDVRYFTPLLHLSDIRFRQFFTLNYSRLMNPDRYFGDRIYMGEHTTLEMKDWLNRAKGTEVFLVKSETDVFSNYEIAGFRLLIYNFLDMGWIASHGNLFKSDNFNYGFGVGIRIRNNFVILNTIDLKIGFYPKLEQSGFDNFFKIKSSTPNMYPNFTPSLPQEITLE